MCEFWSSNSSKAAHDIACASRNTAKTSANFTHNNGGKFENHIWGDLCLSPATPSLVTGLWWQIGGVQGLSCPNLGSILLPYLDHHVACDRVAQRSRPKGTHHFISISSPLSLPFWGKESISAKDVCHDQQPLDMEQRRARPLLSDLT